MKNGMGLWHAVLEVIRPVFGNDAVVAGGAIRDYFLGFEPKDIDVFVNCDGEQAFRNLCETLGATARTFVTGPAAFDDNVSVGEYESWKTGHLFGVADMQLFGYEVNIIARAGLEDGAESLVAGFDSGINQLYFPHPEPTSMGIYATPAAEYDMKHNTYTPTHPETGYSDTAERYERFNHKHPGILTFVRPKWEADFDDL